MDLRTREQPEFRMTRRLGACVIGKMVMVPTVTGKREMEVLVGGESKLPFNFVDLELTASSP